MSECNMAGSVGKRQDLDPYGCHDNGLCSLSFESSQTAYMGLIDWVQIKMAVSGVFFLGISKEYMYV